MDFTQVFSAAIETSLNRYLQLDPDALSRFSALEGKIIALQIRGINQELFLFPSSDGLMVLADFDEAADATISGTPIALAKLGLADDPREQLFNGEVEISGDVRLANQFSRLFSQLNIDWEELLAQNVGDIAAHKMGNLFRDMGQWVKRSTQSVNLDAGEYLQEEIHLSPANAELRSFIKQVDEVREAADRLDARMKRLKSAL
jgi:ubiquinone biosynthesis accessory factor UbiJ